MAKLTINIGAKIDGMKKGLANAQSRVKQWSRKISGLTKLALGTAFVGFGAGMVAIIKKSAQLAAKFEQIKVAFTTMTGSASKAKDLIAELNEFSKATPFSPEQVTKAARTLLAFGFAAKDVKGTLKILGDVSAGTGKDLSEMAVIFGQIKGAGRLMGQDLLQLINAGFNPLQVMADKTGKSMSQLKDEMSKGAISFGMVEDAFKTATSEGGLFFDMMEKQSKTLSGQLSTLEGNVNDLMRQFGELTLPELKIVVLGAQEAVGLLQDLAEARKLTEGADAGKDAGEGGGFDGASVRQRFAMTAIKELGGMAGLAASLGSEMGEAAGKDAAEDFINLLRRAIGKDALDIDGIAFDAPTLAGVEKKKEARAKAKAEDEKAEAEKKLKAELEADKANKEKQKAKNERLSLMQSAAIEGDKFGEEMKAQRQKDDEAAQQTRFDKIMAIERQDLADMKTKASALQKSVGLAFQPGGKIQSRLARIGGDKTINVDRQIPRQQLDELVKLNKGMEKQTARIEQLDFQQRFPQ